MVGAAAFAALRVAVWTWAAVRALPPVAAESGEQGAAFRAWRMLELWLVAWGPTLSPDTWKAALRSVHDVLPRNQQIFPNEPGPEPPEPVGRRPTANTR